MKKVKLKQGTLDWENARSTRIGGSEIFDIVRYYATDEELQNCGINAENFRSERPYTSTWALYHKVKNDGLYKRGSLAPEFAEYGHVVEPYGIHVLQKGRAKKIKAGEVYADDRLIVSLDASGIAEEVDENEPFNFGHGHPHKGQRFVCEQKSMMPQKTKNPVPFKYIVQAQHQIDRTKADFFILQIMVLNEDTPFIRGKICQMSKSTRYKYLDENLGVIHLYFQNNLHLGKLIDRCTDRFFADVEAGVEPLPYIENDSRQNIIESIRSNSLFNPEAVKDYDLQGYLEAKKSKDEYSKRQADELQKIIATAMKYNLCRFRSSSGATAQFGKDGRLLVKEGAR